MKHLRTALALGSLLPALAGCGAGPPAIMQGSALLSRVHAAYSHVPAVEQTNGGGGLHFVLFLRHGVTTAEEVVAATPGKGVVFAHRGGPAYARYSRANCWRIDPSYKHAFTSLGSRFPDALIGEMQGKTARRAGSVWLLPLVRHGRKGTMRIDADTLLVTSLTVYLHGGPPVKVRYRSLRRAPSLPAPRPLCHT